MIVVFYIMLAAAFVFGLPVVAILALTKASKNARELNGIRGAIADLSRQAAALDETLETLRAHLGLPPAPESPESPEATEAPQPEPETRTPDRPIHPAEPIEAQRPLPVPEPAAPQPAAAAQAEAKKPETFEEALTSRWIVWLGAVTVALGAGFLVKYGIDHGWLGPAVRVSFGFVFGVALSIGGEWLRRRPLQRVVAAIRPNHIPPALTAGGLFACFASIYAAYGLHDLLGPLTAFAALAVVALAAMALSLLQGGSVALLGLLGGFLIPALVQTGHPSAWGLFPYLLLIEFACLGLVRYRAWWWLAFAALAGAALWPALWLITAWAASDVLPLGVYLTLIAAAFLFFWHGLETPKRPANWVEEMRSLTMPEVCAWAAGCVFALLAFALVRMAGYDTPGLVFLGIFSCLYLGAARREPTFDGLAVVAAVLVLGSMASWHLPEIVSGPQSLYRLSGQEQGFVPGPVIPPELVVFVTTVGVFGALFGIAGFMALWGAKRPGIWAGVSAVTPVLLLAVAYWRIVDFGLDLRWALVALALAAVSLAAAARVERYRKAQGLAESLGFYAAAVTAFLGLAATMTLKEAWLTVALSVELGALGWIAMRIQAMTIRRIAAIVAVVVLSRLVLNISVLDYGLDSGSLFSWVLYGYGVPAVMFFWAAQMFRRLANDRLVLLLEAGALAFFVLLVSFEIRVLVAGSLHASEYGLLEQSLQSVAWLSIAYLLLVRYRARREIVALWGSRILLGGALAQIVLLQLLDSNPIWTHEFVGAYPVVNLLFIAYAVPAVFAFRFAREMGLAPVQFGARPIGIFGFVLVFVYLSLEIKRAFQGPILFSHHQSDPEFYAYSIGWLLYAVALLGLGIYRRLSALRYASLAVLLITVIKVFLFDMEGLTGLYRAASFMGLGLSLVGIGYLYQRFVFPVRPAPSATA